MPLTPEERDRRKRAYMRQWAQDNKERIPENGRLYRERHKEQLQEKSRQYRLTIDKDKKREYAREWQEKNPERTKAYAQRYYAKNRDMMIEKNRELRRNGATREIERRYRETHKEDMAARREARRLDLAGRPRPECCEVCRDGSKRLEFDHCHQHGHFRGWLCRRCNATLGMIRDDINVLRRLIAYLKQSAPR